MKNKNNVVLTIIAIATILVTVIGATFAYFASTVDEGTGSNFTAVVEEDNVLFTATGSNMTMEVTADKMTEHASSGGVIVAGTSEDSGDNIAIYVELTVGSENPIACKYNIYFQWDSSATAYLTKTGGATKEFTAQLSLAGGGSSGTNKFANETQLTDVVTTTNRTLVVQGASIVASASQSGSQTWSPTIKFYNLQLNQTNLAGKTFKGKFTIDDVECGSATNTVDPNSLSGQILAKVSDDDYTSSQDGSIYKIVKEQVEYQGQTLDAGVRYEGLDPDNYITFNGNEEWRIIGTFEGSTIGLEPGKQYTKIIKNKTLTESHWDSNIGSDWTNATLNAYLNGTYLSSMTDANKIAKYNGEFSTWYLRGVGNYRGLNTQDWYVTERYTGQAGFRDGIKYAADTETKAAIGLMYPSDLGFAAYGTACNKNSSLYEYSVTTDGSNFTGCLFVDWLAINSLDKNIEEWMITPEPESSSAFIISFYWGFSTDSTNHYILVRPSLYLEANLTATGSGTKLDPYVLQDA